MPRTQINSSMVSLTTAAGILLLTAAWPAAWADDMPGVTATSIKIGQTMPYSGQASV